MKIRELLFTLFIATISLAAHGQKSNPSRFYSLLKLNDYYYKAGMPDSMFAISQELITESTTLKNDSFSTVSYRISGNYYYLKSNYAKAIEKYLLGIKIAEENPKVSHLLPQLYNNVGFNYNMLNYHKQAMYYLKKGDSVATENGNNRSLAYLYENMAVHYINREMPDSSLYFLKKSEKSNIQLGKEPNFNSKDSNYIRAAIYTDYAKTYAQIYYRDSSFKYLNKAKSFFIIAIQFSNETQDNKHLANSLYEYANLFFKLNSFDSCQKYSAKSLKLSQSFNYTDLIIKNADLLQKNFSAQGKQREAYTYLKMKDSSSQMLSSMNQYSQILDLTFNESLREKEVYERKKEAKMQRNKYIEFSLIAIGLVTFIIIFLVLSRTFIVNESFVTFFGQIGLLIVFEFINLLIHPTIEDLTHHNSFLMLLILVITAFILIPIHHRLEGYVKIQLVDKNKKIRESIARKILKDTKHKTH
jgi:tetratricopeptide (TPR) repeat protein